jgi:lysophospholipase L1-like esterase
LAHKRPTTLKRRLLFVVWTGLASLVLLEIVLRVAAGFMKPERVLGDLDPDAVHVLAVGDSWVDGAEAPEGEGFVDHLGRDLGGVVGHPVQVLNLGRTGANSAHAALTVLDEAPSVQPALVLVLVGQNNASNFYRVAEVEQRVGDPDARTPLHERLRVVKLGRIILANARGGSGYGDEVLPEIPPLERDEQERDLSRDPWLTQGPGLWWWRRELNRESELTDPTHAPWRVLFASARRDFVDASADAIAIVREQGWPESDASPSAPTARTEGEALARYALLRLAREQRNWRAVRYHGGALLDYEPRSALTDVGAAEAALLGGDWRRARALLVSAHHRAPGLPDAIDLAGRFPDHARDPDLMEVLEYSAPGRLLDHERARTLVQVFDRRAAEDATRRWLEANPEDLTVRVDLARWLLASGEQASAHALLGIDDAEGVITPPTTSSAALWRYHVARVGETGDRDQALAAVNDALEAVDPPDADLLHIAAKTLAAYGFCEAAITAADRWFLARGDANGFAGVIEPCLAAGDAADRLQGLRSAWGPLGAADAFTALVRAGHKPFELLYRDLDLIDAEARKTGGRLLLVNYPNPSEDHTALRDIFTEYAVSRDVPYVDLWAAFEARFSPEQWAEHLGPNGHCNAAGYRIMADEILAFVAAEDLLAAP